MNFIYCNPFLIILPHQSSRNGIRHRTRKEHAMEHLAKCALLGVLLATAAMWGRTAELLHDGFGAVTGIAPGHDDSLYATDWSGGAVVRIAPDGSRHVLTKEIPSPAGAAVDAAGNLYVASYSGDYIAHVAPSGAIRKVAVGLATPTGISFAADGRLLVANRSSGEVVAVEVSSGTKETAATGFSLPVGVAEMPDRSLVVSQYGGGITRVMPDGTQQELGAGFVRPGVGILADGDDAVLAADNGAGAVRRIVFGNAPVVVAENLPGSVVALGRGPNGEALVGTWSPGGIHLLESK